MTQKITINHLCVSVRGQKTQRKCEVCKTQFEARVADVKRGWGKFCSKRCKAIKQEQRTGRHQAFMYRQKCLEEGVEYGAIFHPRTGDFEGYVGCDHEHDCNKE